MVNTCQALSYLLIYSQTKWAPQIHEMGILLVVSLKQGGGLKIHFTIKLKSFLKTNQKPLNEPNLIAHDLMVNWLFGLQVWEVMKSKKLCDHQTAQWFSSEPN